MVHTNDVSESVMNIQSPYPYEEAGIIGVNQAILVTNSWRVLSQVVARQR